MNTIRLRAVIALTLILVAGCGQATDDEPPHTAAPNEPLTWDQWVEREQPRRERFAVEESGMYFRDGLPDMTLWLPSDFLSEDELSAQSISYCEIPIEDRRVLMAAKYTADVTDMEEVETLRHFAQQGSVNAQMAMGFACGRTLYGVRPDESLMWTRKAAASGDARGIGSLAMCLSAQLRHWDAPPSYSFLVDEMLYWQWRTAQHLRWSSLDYLQRLPGGDFVDYGSDEANSIQSHKWGVLAGVVGAFLTGDLEADKQFGMHYDQRAHHMNMTPEQMLAGRTLAREWLLTYPQGFSEYAKDFRCDKDPDGPYIDPDASYIRELHYDGLNRELAQLGLYFDPEAGELEIIGPVAAPPESPPEGPTPRELLLGGED